MIQYFNVAGRRPIPPRRLPVVVARGQGLLMDTDAISPRARAHEAHTGTIRRHGLDANRRAVLPMR